MILGSAEKSWHSSNTRSEICTLFPVKARFPKWFTSFLYWNRNVYIDNYHLLIVIKFLNFPIVLLLFLSKDWNKDLQIRQSGTSQWILSDILITIFNEILYKFRLYLFLICFNSDLDHLVIIWPPESWWLAALQKTSHQDLCWPAENHPASSTAQRPKEETVLVQVLWHHSLCVLCLSVQVHVEICICSLHLCLCIIIVGSSRMQ